MTHILGMCALWPWLWRYDLWSRSWQTLGSWTIIVWNIIQIQHDSEELWPGHIFWVCALWPWPWRYDLGSRSWRTFGSWTTIVLNIKIQHGSEELWPRHRFWVCVCIVNLTLEIWPWFKVMTHIMDNNYLDPTWQRSYGQDTDFGYVCTKTLTLEIWPWFKVMTHIMDNNYLDPTWQRSYGQDTDFGYVCTKTLTLGQGHDMTLGSWTTLVWNIIQIRQGGKKLWPRHDMNRRTGWFLYTSQTCGWGGGKYGKYPSHTQMRAWWHDQVPLLGTHGKEK